MCGIDRIGPSLLAHMRVWPLKEHLYPGPELGQQLFAAITGFERTWFQGGAGVANAARISATVAGSLPWARISLTASSMRA
jgi:hypothetical protein